MKKTVFKLIGWLAVAIVSVILFCIADSEPAILPSPWNKVLELLGGTIFGASLIPAWNRFIDLQDNTSWKVSQRKLLRGNFIKTDSPIRISFAYLFRIKVNGKYFLIKNKRGTGKYQPVGGVYKMTRREADFVRNKFHAEDDNCIEIDSSSKYDYRLRILSRDLREFFKRFDQTKYRESYLNLYREFDEELIAPGLLSGKEFENISYMYIGRHITEIRYEEHFQCYEVLLADIFEIVLSKEQEDQFLNLMKEENGMYYFASEDEIYALGVHPGTQKLQETIADHSKKILIHESPELKLTPKYKKGIITANRNNQFTG